MVPMVAGLLRFLFQFAFGEVLLGEIVSLQVEHATLRIANRLIEIVCRRWRA